MGYYFDFSRYTDLDNNYKFNISHVYIILVDILIFCLLYLLFIFLPQKFKNKEHKINSKLIIALTLFILEIFRIVFDTIKFVNIQGIPFNEINWFIIFSFELCAINVWISIFFLIYSTFKKETRLTEFIKNYLFGIALPGALLTFISPDNVDGHFVLFHIINIQTLTTHMILFFIPIYLICKKEYEPKFNSIFDGAFGSIIVGSISMFGSQISGFSFAYMLRLQLAEDMGIIIPYPFHIIPVMIVLYLLLFLTFFVYKKIHKDSLYFTDQKRLILIKCSSIFIGIILMMCIPMLFDNNPTNIKGLAFLCILPIIYLVYILVILEKLKNHDLTGELDKKNSKQLLQISILSIFPLLYYLKKKENNI
jgi:hypothetical protein